MASPVCPEAMMFRLTEEFRERGMRMVFLTEEERQRLLWWLHQPVPPGPQKDLDVKLIRKLS